MSNVVAFPQAEPEQRHILIEAGTIAGPSTDPSLASSHYFVSMVTGEDHTRIWEGRSRADAVRIAGLWTNWTVIDATKLGGTA
ncbi:hypothetical protein [Kaistia terrae]|uniref:YCII-related domain-containing protein n=1 Tax=Kaistia terrae TaxID=537017 RepID=A0ABW0Q072_9HYPH|nr:hypothetical protein [Kaistia terrae]MCX5580530.1 hypothetical protein [Kaistia terrae]